MKNRFRLIVRGNRGGAYYCVDALTGKRASLGACSSDEAEQIVQAKNQALRQPALNLQIARAYLGGSDEGSVSRTWQHVMDEMVKCRQGATKQRWETANKDKAFGSIRNLKLLETKSDHILHVLEHGTVSTNVYANRKHRQVLLHTIAADPSARQERRNFPPPRSSRSQVPLESPYRASLRSLNG